MEHPIIIKVLHLISSTSFLGAERVVCELANHLDTAQFHCTVGLLGSPDVAVDAFRQAVDETRVSIVYFPCAGKFSWATITAVVNFVKNQHVDIIHSHGYKSDFYSFLARIETRNVRAVATNHNWITNSLSEKVYRCIDLLVLKRYRRIVAVSEKLKVEMSVAGINSDRIKLIMNGISSATPPTIDQALAVRATLGISEGCFVIGCVASLIPVKAHADLLHAFALLVKSVPDSKLLLVGDGPLRQELERTALNLGLEDSVTFLGYRSDARKLYAAFDAFALVSYSEGLPMAMLEAMAAALPVVVSAVGAIPTVITPMKTGFLTTPGDITGIADAFTQLGSQIEFRKKMGKSACDVVASHYSVQRMARDYELVYQEVLEQNP